MESFTRSLRVLFSIITMLIIGIVSFVKIGVVDLHSVVVTAYIIVPAIVVMGYLGQKMGLILDNPRNRADADYRLAVLNALKKMDKSMTLQELNEKLTKTVAEPDAPDIENEDDIDI